MPAYTPDYIKYVDGTSATLGDGSIGDPWGLVQAVGFSVPGTRYMLLGDATTPVAYSTSFLPGDTFQPGGGGTLLKRVEWIGCDDSWNPMPYPTVAIDGGDADFDVATIDTAYNYFQGIQFQNNPSWSNKKGVSVTADRNVFVGCRASNCGSQGFYSNGIGVLFLGCEADLCNQTTTSTYSIRLYRNNVADGCFVHDGGAAGIIFNDLFSTASRCIVARCSGGGIWASYGNAGYLAGDVNNSVIYDCGGYGIFLGHSTASPPLTVRNSIIAANNGYGLAAHATGKGTVNLVNSVVHGNSSGVSDANLFYHEMGDGLIIPAAGDIFEDPDNDDFTVVNSALLAAGFPQRFLVDGVLGLQSYADIGAMQAECTGGGGGLVAAPIGLRGGYIL